MVASDTVVGLVGAGILLVALVGVFVYESQQGSSGSANLSGGSYEVTSKGTASNRARTGTYAPSPPAPADTCVPGGMCTTAQTTVDLTLTGLPDPRGAAYVVFADGTFVSALTKQGADNYTTGGARMIPGQRTAISVTLEPSASSTSPTGPKIYEKTGVTTTPATLVGNFTYRFIPETATLSVSYAAQGGNTNVTVSLTGATNYNNLVYRAWMVKDNADGKTFAHVGNGTADASVVTIGGVVPGTSGSYSYLLVTLEPRGTFDAMAPKGPDAARTG